MINKLSKLMVNSLSISAITLIGLAIASPHGITYYEDRITIKIIEVGLSIIAIYFILKESSNTIYK